MRKEFAAAIKKIATADKKIIFLTGDLGYNVLEELRESIGNRFINAGVSEQNMITMSAALASEGFKPICYSIAPFATFRPAEQIRLDVCLHNMNVKIVGNGGGYGYGIMGATHHAIEDIAVLSSFQNMRCYIPFCNEDVAEVVNQMMQKRTPGYLRLGLASKPDQLKIESYSHTRRLIRGDKVTVVGIGPVIVNVFEALGLLDDPIYQPDLFVVSEMPLTEITPELKKSLKKTGQLVIIEEHVSRGGLAENLALLLAKSQIFCRIEHLYAQGYPDGLYGSQGYHHKVCQLDPLSLAKLLKRLSYG